MNSLIAPMNLFMPGSISPKDLRPAAIHTKLSRPYRSAYATHVSPFPRRLASAMRALICANSAVLSCLTRIQDSSMYLGSSAICCAAQSPVTNRAAPASEQTLTSEDVRIDDLLLMPVKPC